VAKVKRKVYIALSVVLVIALSFTVGAYAAIKTNLVVNGKVADADVQIIKGSSYVPLKAVAQLLGADVKYDGATKTVIITGKDYDPDADKKPPILSYDVDVNVTSGPMTMAITKVTLDPAFKEYEWSEPKKVIMLEAEVENTSADTVNWYVTQGTIVLNTKEQVDMSFLSDRIGGEFIGKVVKKGRIIYEIKSDFDAITSVNFKVSGPSNDSYDRVGEDSTTEIILK
jgi:hypothetical protein